MRIVLIGQAPFGARTLETLLEREENVVAVYAPQEKPNARPDPIGEAARKRGIRLVQPKTYREDRVFRDFVQLRPDLVILAFVADIIPLRYFEAATHGAICYHPSLLPRHRGASGINWAVIMGDSRTGLTIFWPDQGIDTGPILLQKEVEIGPDDTVGSLYFNHLFPMGVEAIAESVRLIREGKAPKIDQDDAAATYEPPCDDRVAALDWSQSAKNIYNHIRGCDPQPGAYGLLRGEKVRFYDARFHKGGPEAVPGTIFGIGRTGIEIAVPGGRILVEKVRPGSAGKMDAADWAGGVNLKLGERFAKSGR